MVSNRKTCLSSKGVLPTLRSRGKYFLLEKLCKVISWVYFPHSTFSYTILFFTPTSVRGTIYIPWTHVFFFFTHLLLYTYKYRIRCLFVSSKYCHLYFRKQKLIFGYGLSQLLSFSLSTAFEPWRFLDNGAKYSVASRSNRQKKLLHRRWCKPVL